MVSAFTVKGRFLMGSSFQKFEKVVRASQEENAREKVFLDLGSKHGVKRKNIIIEAIQAD
ncbi:MAG: 50S ribosomal protein L18a [Candidatus Methanofastidiosa archaeon]|nr:50S ribosomal protein L18a [Candidatus Methanofastidiosa archaeon]